MLDVHPPRHAATSWRDFFVHIATIVIGLLIAIALEQSVEAIHQHREAHQTRESLKREYTENRKCVSDEATLWKHGTAALQNNLLVLLYLQKHPGTAQDELPGTLYWAVSSMMFNHAAWNTAQETGAIKLLPERELAADTFLYQGLQRVEDASHDVWLAINDAEAFALTDPDPTHLSSSQLSNVIGLTQEALNRQVLLGEALINLGENPDLPLTVTRAELNAIRGRSDPLPASLSVAHAFTMARLKAAAPNPVVIRPDDAKR